VATERSIVARFPELIDEVDLARNPQLDFTRLGALEPQAVVALPQLRPRVAGESFRPYKRVRMP
jgi:hypothetical protein